MTAESKVTWVADTRQMEAALNRSEKQVAKLKEEMRKLSQEGRIAGDAWNSALNKTAAANDKWLAGMKRMQDQAVATKRAVEMALLADKGAGFQARQDANLAAAVQMAAKLPAIRAEAVRTKTEIINLGSVGKTQFGDMLGSVLTTVAVVGTATAAYRQWRSEIEGMGQAHRDFTKSLVTELATAGALAEGPQVSAAISAAGAGTPEQRTAALVGLRQAAPLMPVERRIDLMREAARQAPTGVDLQKFGGLMGMLAELKPTAAPGDIADLAAAVEAKAGAGAEKIGGDKFLRAVKSQIASGKTPEEALGFALAALDANVSPETIVQQAVGGRPTREQRFQLARVAPEAVTARTKELMEAQADDMAMRRLDQLATFPEGRAALMEQMVAEARQPGAVGAAEARKQQVKEILRAESARSGMGARTLEGVSETFQTLEDFGVVGGRGRLERQRQGISDEQALVNRAENWGTIGAEEAKRLRAALEANTRALEASNRTRPNNVDRHNEQ